MIVVALVGRYRRRLRLSGSRSREKARQGASIPLPKRPFLPTVLFTMGEQFRPLPRGACYPTSPLDPPARTGLAGGLGLLLAGCLAAEDHCEYQDAEIAKVPTERVVAFLVWVETTFAPVEVEPDVFRAPEQFLSQCGSAEAPLSMLYVEDRDEAVEALRQTTVRACSEWQRFFVPLSASETSFGFFPFDTPQDPSVTPIVQEERQLIFLVENCTFDSSVRSNPQWVFFQ